MDISKWCTRIIHWSFALLFILVPFALTSVNYELFEYNKMMITYALAGIIITAWIIKMIREKEIRIARTPLDIPIAIFLLSQLLATVFSMDPHVSWFGYYSRFNGGMMSTLTYIALFYAFVSNPPSREQLITIVKIALSVGVVVALYAFLEHFGYSMSCLIFTGKFDVSCWVQDVQNRVFATLGQPNWLAAYLVAILPVSFAFVLGKKISLKSLVWAIVALLFFVVLLFTKSRSGLIGFAVADAVFGAFVFIRPRLARIKLQGEALRNFVFLHLVFAATVFFTGTNIEQLDRFVTLKGLQVRTASFQQATPSAQPKTDTLLSTGGTESGVIRTYVWQGAINAWKSSVKTFVIGTGTETFAFAFYQFKPLAHNLTSEWDFLYNKAHNEYLNFLATTGILGLGSYLFFLGAFIWWFLKNNTNAEPSNNSSQFIIRNSLFAGWISILITNFFGFSVVIMQLFLFLFPAMIIVSTEMNQYRTRALRLRQSFSRTLMFSFSLAGLLLLYILGRFWHADTLYAKGNVLNRFGKVVEAKTFLEQAIQQNPTEPVYYDEDSLILAQLAAAEFEARNATSAAILAKQSLEENDRAISISPNNVNFWKSRTKIYYAFADFDPQFVKAAIEALSHSLTLSPTDPKITYNLAILYGRLGDANKAIKLLRDTIALKPNYRDAYAALVIFYKETKQKPLAREVISEYLTKVDAQDKDFIDQLKQQ